MIGHKTTLKIKKMKILSIFSDQNSIKLKLITRRKLEIFQICGEKQHATENHWVKKEIK